MNKSDKSNEIGLWLSCLYLLPIFWDDLLIISSKKQDIEDSKSMKISYAEEIDFGSINQEKYRISNTIFKETVTLKLELGSDNYRGFKLDFTFKNCHFERGILFDIYAFFSQGTSQGGAFSLIFDSCLIDKTPQNKEENRIYSSDVDFKIILLFTQSVIDGFNLKGGEFNYLQFSRSIFIGSATIESIRISPVYFQNTLGIIFVTNVPNVSITYADENLMMIEGIVRDAINEIVRHKGLKKIFEYPTKYIINDTREIDIIFRKAQKSGFGSIASEISKDRKIIRRKAYFLTNQDIDLLDISINAELSKTQNISINGGFLNVLHFHKKSNSSSDNGKSDISISIENTKCNFFRLANISFKEMRLYDFQSHKEQSKFEVKNSDLTDAWFDKVKLGSFEICSFYRTTLENTIFSATEFPKEIKALENIHYPKKTKDNYYDSLYENYRQIKTALLNQNNHIQALEMHRQMYNAVRKSKNLECQDKIILWANRISNNHGTSILRALGLSILLIILFGILYCLALPNAPYRFGWSNYESFLLAIEESCKFIHLI